MKTQDIQKSIARPGAFLLLALLLVSPRGAHALPSRIDWIANQDAVISGSLSAVVQKSDWNTGRDSLMAVGTYDDNTISRSLIRFPVPAGYTSDSIGRAVIRVTSGRWVPKNTKTPFRIEVHQILKSWKEGAAGPGNTLNNSAVFDGVTAIERFWGDQDGSEDWHHLLVGVDDTDASISAAAAVTKPADYSGTWDFDITPLAKYWADHRDKNFGVLLTSDIPVSAPATEDYPWFYTREALVPDSSKPLLILNGPAVPQDTVASKPTLVAYWDFEDSGTTLHDRTAHGHNGTVTAATWTDGIRGKGLSFNGTSSQVLVPFAADLSMKQFTLSAWIKTNIVSGGEIILSRQTPLGSSGTYNYRMFLTNAGSNAAGSYPAGHAAMDFVPTSHEVNKTPLGHKLVADGNWHNVTGVLRGTTVEVYVDGVLDTALVTGNVVDTTSTEPLRIGAMNYGDHAYFQGVIDEVSIYNGALSATQVDSLYQASKPAAPSPLVAYWDFEDGAGTVVQDRSGHGHNGTVIGTAAWSTGGARGGAMDFNGSTKVVVPFDSAFNLSEFTVAAWVKTSDSTLDQCVLCRLPPSGSPSNYRLMLSGQQTLATKWRLPLGTPWFEYNEQASLGFANDSTHVSASSPIGRNVWHYVAGSYKNRLMKIYVDGRLSNQYTVSEGDQLPFVGGGEPISIGGSSYTGASLFLKGSMDEVRLYSIALNDTSVDSLYRASSSTLSSVIAYWDFEDGSGTTVRDRSGHGHNGTVSGTAVWAVGGAKGNSMYFNGSTKVVVPYDSAFNLSAYSYVGWVEKAGTGDGTIIAQQSSSTVPYRRLWVSGSDSAGSPWYLPSGTAMMGYADTSSGAANTRVRSKISVDDAAWHQVAGTYADGVTKIYVDGKLDSARTGFPYPPQSAVGQSVTLGGSSSGSAGWPMVGWLDEIRMYGVALDSASVAGLYAAVRPTVVSLAGKNLAARAAGPRLERSGALSFVVRGLGNGSASVTATGLDGREAGSWNNAREGQVLQLSRGRANGVLFFRIRTASGETRVRQVLLP